MTVPMGSLLSYIKYTSAAPSVTLSDKAFLWIGRAALHSNLRASERHGYHDGLPHAPVEPFPLLLQQAVLELLQTS